MTEKQDIDLTVIPRQLIRSLDEIGHPLNERQQGFVLAFLKGVQSIALRDGLPKAIEYHKAMRPDV